MSEFIWPVRVYYEDTDAGGVVYHSNYLNFMERARTEWLRHLGFEQDQMLAEGVVFVVGRVNITYIRPLRFNDELEISAKVTKLGQASLVFQQEIRKKNEPDKLLATAEIKVASVDTEHFRPTAIPDAIKAEINRADK
ncbi:MAG: tol-pal system-associated acyl-CoA thioesterase [Candidatus Polarisedimenticolaceae bacterium]|nr:tol-pal system-associated acyl-CoA thioesterase [Candidatus Polarisedimenticolaceae bacterium]